MKIFLLFSILPVLGTAAGSPTKAGPHTEAGFSVTCAGCGDRSRSESAEPQQFDGMSCAFKGMSRCPGRTSHDL